MKLKLLATILFCLVWIVLAQAPIQRLLAQSQELKSLPLDLKGRRGVVLFSHAKHEAQINPSPDNPHQTQPGAACIGCHHKVGQMTVAVQFRKCSDCHKTEGHPDNPEDKEGYELNSMEASHRACIGCHLGTQVNSSNYRFKQSGFTKCSECHDREITTDALAQRSEDRKQLAPPDAAARTVSSPKELPPSFPPALPLSLSLSLPPSSPLGYDGPSRIARPEPAQVGFIPTPDRWRIGFPEDPRYLRGSRFNPYRQNYLKGDYPIIGQQTFLNLGVESDAQVNARRLPGALDRNSQPGSADLFSRGNQIAFRQNLILTVDLFHGDTAFKPVDWRVNVAAQVNVNYLHTQRNGIVNLDPSSGNSRTASDPALQTAFFERRLGDTTQLFPFLRGANSRHGESPHFDFTSIRVGVQPFISDFRGFIFNDVNLGVRLFGNQGNNRSQFNLAFFELLEKDVNSELNTPRRRAQSVLAANLYRQDLWMPGYFAQFSFHFNHDRGGPRIDENGFVVRPAVIGDPALHELKVVYLGWAGDGHLGRLNINHALYQAFGNDSRNPIAGRETSINARMAAVEASINRDWLRFKSSFFFASGDQDPSDGAGRGFDAILDLPEFAGGRFSFWNSQGIRLTRTGVNLVGQNSLLPNLRSNKFAGQANFVNPGILIYNAGIDADLTPKLKAILNFNYLHFHHTDPLESILSRVQIERAIGFDYGVGLRFRPFLSENAIIDAGYSSLIPGRGFKQIFNAERESAHSLHSVFLRLRVVY